MPSQQNGAAEKYCRAALRNSTGDFARNFAGPRNLMAVRGEPPVTSVENVSAEWCDAKKINWICPPDLFHRAAIGVRTLNFLAARKQQAQVLQQSVFTQPQFRFELISL